MTYLEYLLGLFVAMLFKLPWLLLIFIGIILFCCILACRAKTFKAIALPSATVIVLSMMSLAMLFYILKFTIGI